MRNRILALAVAAMVIAGSAGCSSDRPPAKLKHGVLSPGTARLTIDGADAGETHSVQCAAVGPSTTIRMGDNDTGATMMLSTKVRLTVEFVRIRNENGFSGDYNVGLGDDATVALTEATYHVNGTAMGYAPDSIAPRKHTFAVEAAC
jgi:hypothetical protein